MKKILYQSSRKFKIWAYTVSHSSLLLRSEMKYPDEDGYSEDISFNIDLEFYAVSYMNIPSSLSTIILAQVLKRLAPNYIVNECKYTEDKIFEIESQNRKYYIIAGGVLVGSNKWENKDRIFDYHLELKHDKVFIYT